MIKRLNKLTVLLLAVTMFSGCATLLGGKITTCQKTKPTDGTHRKIRWFFFIFDTPVGWIIDFHDGAIYKPCKTTK